MILDIFKKKKKKEHPKVYYGKKDLSKPTERTRNPKSGRFRKKRKDAKEK